MANIPTQAVGPAVLVVDDDEDVLSLLALHLTMLGCRVTRASSGEEGLRRALADPPDVVIIDVVLPGMGGSDLAVALRADSRTRGSRLVMTSVLDREDLAAMHVTCGTDAILPKPFSRRDVSVAVGPRRGGASR